MLESILIAVLTKLLSKFSLDKVISLCLNIIITKLQNQSDMQSAMLAIERSQQSINILSRLLKNENLNSEDKSLFQKNLKILQKELIKKFATQESGKAKDDELKTDYNDNEK